MLDWLIVGGGIHGTHLAARLIGEAKVPHDRIRVIDPESRLLERWRFNTAKTGMKHLRSPSVHNLKRRAMITEARHRGSMPRDVLRALRHATEQGQIRWHQDEVYDLVLRPPAMMLERHGRLSVDRVLLATGFCGHRPGGALVDELIASSGLACAHCGYPIVGKDLAWASGLYVSGPLAELELGPTSRNIAGARRAGDRLVKVAQAA